MVKLHEKNAKPKVKSETKTKSEKVKTLFVLKVPFIQIICSHNTYNGKTILLTLRLFLHSIVLNICVAKEWGVGAEWRVPPLAAKFAKIGKRKKFRKKEDKSGRKGKNWEGSFTLPLLTDRVGYATGYQKIKLLKTTDC